jgi:hypothetical protein
MDSQRHKRSSSAFEYFLYLAILAETALAAVIYKVIFRSAELARVRVYFAIFYFAFLAWAIAQLNMLHRDRSTEEVAQNGVRRGQVLGLLCGARRTLCASKEPEQPESAPLLAAEAAPAPREHIRPPFGLSGVQLAIVVLVFATAVATFSWALRLLR